MALKKILCLQINGVHLLREYIIVHLKCFSTLLHIRNVFRFFSSILLSSGKLVIDGSDS